MVLQPQDLNKNNAAWNDTHEDGEEACLMADDIQNEELCAGDDALEDEEAYAAEEQTEIALAPNQALIHLSWSLMNQLKFMSRNEGIPLEDLLIELITEGTTKRVFEEQHRPMPSHLMTRNGYVHNTDGNAAAHQPQMSHHASMQPPYKFSNVSQGGQQRPNKHYTGQNRQNNPNYVPQGQRYNNGNGNGGGNHYNKNFNGNGNGGGQRSFQNGFYQGNGNVNGNQKQNFQGNYNGQNRGPKMHAQNSQGGQGHYANAAPRSAEEHEGVLLKNKK